MASHAVRLHPQATFPGTFRERFGGVPVVHSYRFVPLVSFAGIAALAALPVASCGNDALRAPGGSADASARGVVIDAFGDTLAVGGGRTYARVASLNPATTELVFALGAGTRLVGRTQWDHAPDSARFVPDLGDGMRPNVEAVLAARPDLVLLYASDENRAARDALRAAGVATLAQRIDLMSHFAGAVLELGLVFGDTGRAAAVRDSVLATVNRVRDESRGRARPRVVWPLWDAPLMVVGRGSFLHELLETAGAENVFADLDLPSPSVSFEEVIVRAPDVILVAPDRAEAIRADARWRRVKNLRVVAYDTVLVGRPGVRMGEAAQHLARILHTVPPTPRQ